MKSKLLKKVLSIYMIMLILLGTSLPYTSVLATDMAPQEEADDETNDTQGSGGNTIDTNAGKDGSQDYELDNRVVRQIKVFYDEEVKPRVPYNNDMKNESGGDWSFAIDTQGKYVVTIDGNVAEIFVEGYKVGEYEEDGKKYVILEIGKTYTISAPFTSINFEILEVIDANATEADVWALEVAWTELWLTIGDFLTNSLTSIVGQEVTIDRIIFNRIAAVNANFFEKNDGTSLATIENPTSDAVREIVTTWYDVFRKIAILFYIGVLILSGIRMMLASTPFNHTKSYESAKKWLAGILLLFFFPFVIKYAFLINSTIVKMVRTGLGNTETSGISIGGVEEYTLMDIEFRSPQYISKRTGQIFSYTTDEVTKVYKASLDRYIETIDVMRIMRAYAGATGRFVYVIIWYILIWQTLLMLIKYYKRYFIIALFIMIFPLISIYATVENVIGRQSKIFNSWCKELFLNIFMQSVHCIAYGICAGVAMSHVRAELLGGGQMVNWILVIIAITFLTQAETIIRKIFSTESTTATSMADTGKATKTHANQTKKRLPGG